MGRPSKVRPWLTADGLNSITEWAEQGYSEAQISKMLDIDAATLVQWKKRFINIANAIKKGKDKHLEKQRASIETGLSQICEIHWLEETEIYKTLDGQGNVEKQFIRTKKKQVDPNVTALIFKAKHLIPEKYGDEIVADDGNVEEWHNEIAEAVKSTIGDENAVI